ncbi:TIGR03118 family protein [Myxococcus llanfairpwllgwyngyllgogerychwyrndrobwllllantysiliogogogochensis]|uniref:TIGR03118 family protein n=1 Tax=Myxococcus llanfairpwllgwyngyllgogerychwyrndrobwllllantysiliogogogochensis TaxID=2590453 RepID=A0A540X4B3_9BACT|nr:TIGR03118 family protein [Myxococcus llanfairpwllgwyngyllgogerychwyrndrobwllllantysiliogogogochensis]TQF16039.1 TIGR03118 family protein [Myxococcus llanfairpwllgwyngyllgogerychwyrndrobwllllantysiliogogogochensis]
MRTTSIRGLGLRCGGYVAGLSLAVVGLPGVAIAQAPGELPNSYLQRNLVSDGATTAEHVDPNLVNGWGLAFNPFGVAWVADNGTGNSTLYDGDGTAQPLVVSIPVPTGAMAPASPTGVVFNGSEGFAVSQGTASGPARFIFVTEQGVVAAWSPTAAASNAILTVDNSSKGSIYKGAALASNGTATYLYATDFHNGRVDVFDNKFAPATLSGNFTDPNLPAGFAPFGIQNINGDLYVSYAQQDAERKDDVHGPGLGYVNVFDPNGRLIRRLISAGNLNAPWGMAVAPASFGRFAGRLLVGNFGDGTINAFDSATGTFDAQLLGADGKPVMIDGLWALGFGNGLQNQPSNTLFFTAGPADETHGLYGRLDVATTGPTRVPYLPTR